MRGTVSFIFGYLALASFVAVVAFEVGTLGQSEIKGLFASINHAMDHVRFFR